MLQHQLGVVAARLLLDHGGRARRRKPRQQHRGLDLGRSHRRAIEDRDRIASALKRQRQPAALPTHRNLGAHQFQGIEHPPHRPGAQRGVAVEYGRDRTARDRPHHQPASGAGIAEIERSRRFSEAGHADATHDPSEIAGPFHARTQRPHGFGGIEHVFALKQARDTGLADRQRAQDQGPVGDRLVAGNADVPDQRAAGTRD